jgi:hypothetical protein
MPIQRCEQLTPARLTAILRMDGALQHGNAVRIDATSQTDHTSLVSHVASLKVQYSDDATGALPRRLFLKMSLWDINIAAIDLTLLMALHWSPQRRAVLERPLLRRYYDRLVTNGLGDYSWDNLWCDYREAVIVMTRIPIGQFRRQSPAGRVWCGVQDSTAAFEDLHCAELL